MSEEKENLPSESKEEKSSYEKLRDELFDTRVDLKAWVRSIKIMLSFAAAFLATLAYFGYDKIQSVEKAIIDQANSRLAKSDALLAMVDEKKLNQINKRLSDKEKEYEIMISSFNKFVSKNKELQEVLLKSMEPNEVLLEPEIPSITLADSEFNFEVRPFPSTIKAKSKQDIYLTFQDGFPLNDAEMLGVYFLQMSSESSYKNLKKYIFKGQQRQNKLSFTVNVAPDNYLLRVGYLKKSKDRKNDNTYVFYSKEYPVKVDP